jgi:hypothetical protein
MGLFTLEFDVDNRFGSEEYEKRVAESWKSADGEVVIKSVIGKIDEFDTVLYMDLSDLTRIKFTYHVDFRSDATIWSLIISDKTGNRTYDSTSKQVSIDDIQEDLANTSSLIKAVMNAYDRLK